MNAFSQSECSFAEIMRGKQERRDALSHAVRAASLGDIEAAAQRLREVMRESKGEMRRQRIDPPAFAIKEIT